MSSSVPSSHSDIDRILNLRKLHCRPSAAAILSSLMSGVFPTASKALSRTCARCDIFRDGSERDLNGCEGEGKRDRGLNTRGKNGHGPISTWRQSILETQARRDQLSARSCARSPLSCLFVPATHSLSLVCSFVHGITFIPRLFRKLHCPPSIGYLIHRPQPDDWPVIKRFQV